MPWPGPIENDMKQYIAARDVVVGDIIAFDTPKQAMTVERLSVATSDGAIGVSCEALRRAYDEKHLA